MDNLRNETLNGSGNQEEKYDQEAIDQVVDIVKENSEISNIIVMNQLKKNKMKFLLIQVIIKKRFKTKIQYKMKLVKRKLEKKIIKIHRKMMIYRKTQIETMNSFTIQMKTAKK